MASRVGANKSLYNGGLGFWRTVKVIGFLVVSPLFELSSLVKTTSKLKVLVFVLLAQETFDQSIPQTTLRRFSNYFFTTFIYRK